MSDDLLRDELLLDRLGRELGIDVEPEPMLIGAGDVARELGVSIKTVRRLDLARKLPRPVRLGRTVRWRRQELRDWVLAGCPRRDEWTWRPKKK